MKKISNYFGLEQSYLESSFTKQVRMNRANPFVFVSRFLY